jgi:hypothetical protein
MSSCWHFSARPGSLSRHGHFFPLPSLEAWWMDVLGSPRVFWQFTFKCPHSPVIKTFKCLIYATWSSQGGVLPYVGGQDYRRLIVGVASFAQSDVTGRGYSTSPPPSWQAPLTGGGGLPLSPSLSLSSTSASCGSRFELWMGRRPTP